MGNETIKTNVRPRSISEILRDVEDGKIVVPPFQRDAVWNTEKKSRFILSILEDVSVPPINLAKLEGDRKWELLDGLQRITALREFINGDFKLKFSKDEEPLFFSKGELEGKRFEDLPEELKAKIEDRILGVVESQIPKRMAGLYFEIIAEMFKRINTNPTPLSPGDVLYSFTYHPELSPELLKLAKESAVGETKQKEEFKTLVRYLFEVENAGNLLSDNPSFSWKGAKFYERVIATFLKAKREYLDMLPEKERKRVINETLQHAAAFRDFATTLRGLLEREVERRFDKKRVYRVLLEKYYEKVLQKELKKFEKGEGREPTEEELEGLKKIAERKAEEYVERNFDRLKKQFIEGQKRKIVKEYSIERKGWLAEVFTGFRMKQLELGISPKRFMEKYGFESLKRFIRDKEIAKILAERRTLERNNIIKMISKALEVTDAVIKLEEERNRKEQEEKKNKEEVIENFLKNPQRKPEREDDHTENDLGALAAKMLARSQKGKEKGKVINPYRRDI